MTVDSRPKKIAGKKPWVRVPTIVQPRLQSLSQAGIEEDDPHHEPAGLKCDSSRTAFW